MGHCKSHLVALISQLQMIHFPTEVDDCIKETMANCSGKPSGIHPVVLRALPVNWILFLTCVFNALFASAITQLHLLHGFFLDLLLFLRKASASLAIITAV